MSQVGYKENLALGAFLVTFSGLLLALMGFFSRLSTPYTSTGFIVFFQSLIAFILLVPIVIYKKVPLKTKRLPWLILRALTGTGAWLLLYQSIHLTSLTVGTLLTFSSPLLVPFVTHFILKNKIGAAVWLAVFVGFVGIVLVLNPFKEGQSIFNLGILLGVGSAVLMTITQFTLRVLSQTEETLTVLFYYLLLSAIIFFPSALLNWHMPSGQIWIYIGIIGVLMLSSQFLFTSAYRFASPVNLGAFIYLTIVFSAILDHLFLKADLGWLTWVGILLVIIGGVMVIRLEQKRVTPKMEKKLVHILEEQE